MIDCESVAKESRAMRSFKTSHKKRGGDGCDRGWAMQLACPKLIASGFYIGIILKMK